MADLAVNEESNFQEIDDSFFNLKLPKVSANNATKQIANVFILLKFNRSMWTVQFGVNYFSATHAIDCDNWVNKKLKLISCAHVIIVLKGILYLLNDYYDFA